MSENALDPRVFAILTDPQLLAQSEAAHERGEPVMVTLPAWVLPALAAARLAPAEGTDAAPRISGGSLNADDAARAAELADEWEKEAGSWDLVLTMKLGNEMAALLRRWPAPPDRAALAEARGIIEAYEHSHAVAEGVGRDGTPSSRCTCQRCHDARAWLVALRGPAGEP